MALRGGRAVGFALFFTTFSTFLCKPGLYLEDLFVEPEHRGAGIGKALLKRLAALAVERAGRAASIGYLQVAFAMIWQIVFFGEPPTGWTLGGAALILGGTLGVDAAIEALLTRPLKAE